MLQDDILCLVFGHPLAHYFLFEPKTHTNTTSYTTFPSGYPSATLLSQTPVPEVRRISPRERSVFSVRYRCLCEIIASGGREGKHSYFDFLSDFTLFVCDSLWLLYYLYHYLVINPSTRPFYIYQLFLSISLPQLIFIFQFFIVNRSLFFQSHFLFLIPAHSFIYFSLFPLLPFPPP